MDPPVTTTVRHDGVDAMLADARSRLHRLDVGEVSLALRPLVIERNVLERRFDPRSEACLPEASYDARILVLCQEGYTSSLAADALRSLGLDATDVEGGSKPWREAHLPTGCPRDRP